MKMRDPDAAYTLGSMERACPKCHGEGRIPNGHGTDDQAGGWADTCDMCNGSGQADPDAEQRLADQIDRADAAYDALAEARETIGVLRSALAHIRDVTTMDAPPSQRLAIIRQYCTEAM